MLDEPTIKMALEQLERMLRDPTVEIETSNGLMRRPNFSTGFMEYERTGGRTITIKVQGGGSIEEEDPNAATWRLLRELRQ